MQERRILENVRGQILIDYQCSSEEPITHFIMKIKLENLKPQNSAYSWFQIHQILLSLQSNHGDIRN